MSRYLSFGAILAAVAIVLSAMGGCWRDPPAPPKPASAALPITPPPVPAPVVINKAEPPRIEPPGLARVDDVPTKLAGVESIPAPPPAKPDCKSVKRPSLIAGCIERPARSPKKLVRRDRWVPVDDGVKTWRTFRRAN